MSNKLHGEHEASITARFEKAVKLFAGSSKQKQTVITVAEANVIIVLANVQQICEMFQAGVDSIEAELRRQVCVYYIYVCTYMCVYMHMRVFIFLCPCAFLHVSDISVNIWKMYGDFFAWCTYIICIYIYTNQLFL